MDPVPGLVDLQLEARARTGGYRRKRHMIFNLFKKKKSGLKLRPKQEVEIEFLSDESDSYECYFTRVLDIQRKKVILKAPGTERRPIRMFPGQQVTITTLDENTLYAFQATVLDATEREFDITPPANVHDEELPARDENFRLEVPITVEYRAMNTAHTQVAQTFAITSAGLVLATNLPIPPGTSLHMELEIPSTPDIRTKGRAIGSEKHPDQKSKHLSEIEFEDMSESDRDTILRYAIYSRRRQERQREWGEEEELPR
jgi:c-di-GMP-binding flagellar brake protein YcgR